jgi:hypothetical protein
MTKGQRWLFLAGLVTVGAVALLLSLRPTSRQEALPPANGKVPGIPQDEVCVGGTQTTLEAAAAQVSFPLETPQDDLANDGNMTEVWQCSEDQVAFKYESGVVVYLTPNTFKDPASVWSTMAKDYPEFSTGTVRGVPASLSDPAKAEGAKGGVDLVENGLRVTVSGDGEIPLGDLVRVTESIMPVDSSTQSPSGTPG